MYTKFLARNYAWKSVSDAERNQGRKHARKIAMGYARKYEGKVARN